MTKRQADPSMVKIRMDGQEQTLELRGAALGRTREARAR